MKRVILPLLVLGVALLGVVLVVAGADGGDGDGGASVDEGPVFVTWGDPPKVEVNPKAAPPRELQVEDLEEGDGDEATDGDELTVRYVATDWNGQPTSSSWAGAKAEPFSFVLGLSPPAVNPGWDRGVAGMKEGGRREIRVPTELLYLPWERPEGELPPTDAEIYVVELVELEPR